MDVNKWKNKINFTGYTGYHGLYVNKNLNYICLNLYFWMNYTIHIVAFLYCDMLWQYIVAPLV